MGNQAVGIRLVRSVDQLRRALHYDAEVDQDACMRRWDETASDLVRDDDDVGTTTTGIEEIFRDRIEPVRRRVYDMTGELIEAVSGELFFTAKAPTAAIADCFEIFGLDYMIDPDWNVWLLE